MWRKPFNLIFVMHCTRSMNWLIHSNVNLLTQAYARDMQIQKISILSQQKGMDIPGSHRDYILLTNFSVLSNFLLWYYINFWEKTGFCFMLIHCIIQQLLSRTIIKFCYFHNHNHQLLVTFTITVISNLMQGEMITVTIDGRRTIKICTILPITVRLMKNMIYYL